MKNQVTNVLKRRGEEGKKTRKKRDNSSISNLITLPKDQSCGAHVTPQFEKIQPRQRSLRGTTNIQNWDRLAEKPRNFGKNRTKTIIAVDLTQDGRRRKGKVPCKRKGEWKKGTTITKKKVTKTPISRDLPKVKHILRAQYTKKD